MFPFRHFFYPGHSVFSGRGKLPDKVTKAAFVIINLYFRKHCRKVLLLIVSPNVNFQINFVHRHCHPQSHLMLCVHTFALTCILNFQKIFFGLVGGGGEFEGW